MQSLPITSVELGVALSLVTIGSLIQGSIGIGLAVVSAPILLLVNPVFVPGPMLLDAMVLVALMALRERSSVVRRDVALASMGRIVGMVPGVLAVSRLPAASYELLFGILILVAIALSVGGWQIHATARNVALAAVLSGFTGTVSSVGGPPMALVYQNEKGPRMRGTLSAIFTVGTVISLAGLWWVGRFGWVELLLGAILLPGVVVGFALSHFTKGHVDKAYARPALLTISALSGLVILARALF